MISEQKIHIKKGVYYLFETGQNEFEELYLKIRERERRIYTDSELKFLPEIKHHPLSKEWKIRKNSLQKLISYLKAKNRFLNILEIGCGNGWLSDKLASIENSYVIGVDINKFELEQAARVFSNRKNLKFFYADIFADYFELGDFDIILLASSIQYFKSIVNLIERLLYLSKRNGEIHIIDSPFYNYGEIEKAKIRTLGYYKKIGFPEMAEFYFHHSFEDLKKYDPLFLYLSEKKNLFSSLFRRDDSPFPWIVIKKK